VQLAIIIMGSLMDSFLQSPLGKPLAHRPIPDWFPSFGPTQFAAADAFGHTAPWGHLVIVLTWPAAFAVTGLLSFVARTRTPEPARPNRGRKSLQLNLRIPRRVNGR
jgi:ABC-2 type transport system permease protein